MNAAAFREKATRLPFRFFLLAKLPLAFLAGVRIKEITKESCTTVLRFKWINQNPFRSMYFAAMHMAAELSSGLLFYQYTGEDKFSMLLLNTEASYHKKAKGTITFKCAHGKEAYQAIKEDIKALETTEIVMNVLAENSAGELIARFSYTWGLKNKA
jgi:hypothetical protein